MNRYLRTALSCFKSCMKKHCSFQVLAEGSQMRKEADDTGPLAELEYWKHRTAKFSCLVDQIKTQPCRGVISTLNASKSKIIKVIILQLVPLPGCFIALFPPPAMA